MESTLPASPPLGLCSPSPQKGAGRGGGTKGEVGLCCLPLSVPGLAGQHLYTPQCTNLLSQVHPPASIFTSLSPNPMFSQAGPRAEARCAIHLFIPGSVSCPHQLQLARSRFVFEHSNVQFCPPRPQLAASHQLPQFKLFFFFLFLSLFFFPLTLQHSAISSLLVPL